MMSSNPLEILIFSAGSTPLKSCHITNTATTTTTTTKESTSFPHHIIMPRTMDSDQNVRPHATSSNPQQDAVIGFEQIEPRVAAREAMADPEREEQRSNVTMKNPLNAAAPINQNGEAVGEGAEMPPTGVAKAVSADFLFCFVL